MHRVLKMWIRPEKGGAPLEREALELEAGLGVLGDHRHGARRHVTIVFREDWEAAARDLGETVDPAARRANVLVSGGDGARLVGSKIRLGEAEIEVAGITEPCERMDAARTGLRKALEPGGRGGVWGRVLRGGTVRVGDGLE